MSRGVRDVFILAGLIALYGVALWLYEAKLAETFGETLSENPRAIFARDHDRERMIAEENNAETFTPPADDMLGTTNEGEAPDGTD
jgi:hypothetical protein